MNRIENRLKRWKAILGTRHQYASIAPRVVQELEEILALMRWQRARAEDER